VKFKQNVIATEKITGKTKISEGTDCIEEFLN
jgi:hypothetical protein